MSTKKTMEVNISGLNRETKKKFRRQCSSAQVNKFSRKDLLPPLDMRFKMKSIIDVDPDFYSVIDGRPLKPNNSIREYKRNVRDITLHKVTTGFIEDEIMRIKKEIQTERIAYEEATKHFEECKKSFEKFLEHDNNETMKIIKTCDNVAKDLALASDLHKKLSYEVAMLRSKLQYMDETRMILISYEQFLHNISPMWWQRQNNVVENEESPKHLVAVTSDIFLEMKPADIQKLIERRLPPRLFFGEPEQILIVFEMLEQQNLYYLLKCEEINALLIKAFCSKESIKLSWNKEKIFLQEQVSEIESCLDSYDAREEELKQKFSSILNDKIKYLVSSETALKLYHSVEFVYEHVISSNDINDTPINMLRTIDKEFCDIIFELEGMDLATVREIENEVFTENAKNMEEAERAHKLLKNYDKVRKRLRIAFESYARPSY